MSRNLIVVRCPRCGSTDAGEVGGLLEFTEMRCASCGHSDFCDEYQLKDIWNVTIDLPDDAVALPKAISPRMPMPCAACNRAPPYFMIRPSGSRDEAYVEVEKLWAIRRCRSCFVCYHFGFSEGGMVSDDEDDVDKLDMATSCALLAMSAGELTAQQLAALAALPEFSWWRIEDAVTAQLDFAPILVVNRAEGAAGRGISWRLVASAARAGAEVEAFVAPLVTQLEEAIKAQGQHASERVILLTDVVESFLERGLDVSAAISAARAVLVEKSWLRELRPRLAALCG